MRWVTMLERWLTGRGTSETDRMAEFAARQRQLAQELGELKGELDEQQRVQTAAVLRRREAEWDDH